MLDFGVVTVILLQTEIGNERLKAAEQRLIAAELQVNMPMAWLIATGSLVNVAEQRLKDTDVVFPLLSQVVISNHSCIWQQLTMR